MGRFKTLIAFLTAVAFAVLVPSTASAHHCKGPHASAPECSSGGGGGDGGGSGGFGELGNGCVAFEAGGLLGTLGTFHDDDRGAYCNGTDGQVSVPSRLRLDTKKFNSAARKYLLEAICEANSSVCDRTVEVRVLQSQLLHRWIDGQLVATGQEELDFQAMKIGDIERVSVDLAIGKNTKVLFGNDTGDRMRCPSPSEAAPLWVQCLEDRNDDGFCDLWTMTTTNLDVGSAESDARACLTESSVMVDGEITADFTMGICVLGVTCP